jgi:predicted metal-dependent peptidase
MVSYQLNNAERIIKAKVDLNKSHPFFSYILMHFHINKAKTEEECPTMAVNQFGDLYWCEEFVKKLTNEELRAVLCHETLHVATLTFQRKGRRDHTIWNIATDLVINWILTQERFQLPKGVLLADHRGIYTFKSGKSGKDIQIDLNNKNAEQVYEDLSKHAKQIKEITNADDEGNYDGQVGKHLQGDKDAQGNSTGKGKNASDVSKNESDWKRKAVEASTQAKMRGNMSAELERIVGSLLEPVVDWRNRLYAFITNELPCDFTMRTPSRRFISTGVYTPSVIRENLEVIIGEDVSGSIGMEESREFRSECVGISESFRQVKMRYIGWACTVDPEDDYLITNDNKNQLLDVKFKNSGGTTLESFTNYIKEKEYKARVIVILTDGYIEHKPVVPEGVPILFVVSKNGSKEIVQNYGEVCSLNDVRRDVDRG